MSHDKRRDGRRDEVNGIELRVVFEVTKLETNYTVNKESYMSMIMSIQVPLRTQIRDTANYMYQVVIFMIFILE